MSEARKLKLNVRLLRRIQKLILEEPKRCLMSCSSLKAKTQKEWEWKVRVFADDASKQIPPCGTAACIAGWADTLMGGTGEGHESLIRRASLALGIEPTLHWSGNRVFSAKHWPEPFAERYAKTKTPSSRAKVAAARIDHLIKTGE